MKLIRIATIFWLMLTALCGSALLYGHTQDIPEYVRTSGFSVCDGNPCYMGITPGITTWADAKLVLSPSSKDSQDNTSFVVSANNSTIQLNINPDFKHVGFVYISPHDSFNLPSLAYFIEIYGRPCKLMRTRYSGQVAVIFDSMVLDAVLKSDALRMDSPVENVQLVDLTPNGYLSLQH